MNFVYEPSDFAKEPVADEPVKAEDTPAKAGASDPEPSPETGPEDSRAEPEGKSPDAEEQKPEPEESPEEIAARKAAAREAYKARAAQREREELRAELERVKAEKAAAEAARSNPASDLKPPTRPNPKDPKYSLGRWGEDFRADEDKYFEDVQAYNSRLAEKVVEDRLAARLNEIDQRQKDVGIASKAEEVGRRGVDKYGDFEDIVTDAFTAMPADRGAMTTLLQRSNAEDVLYYLATRPAELERITALGPMDQALEFGSIAASLASRSKVQQTRVSKATPTPTQPRGKSGEFKSEDDARYDRMLEARRKGF